MAQVDFENLKNSNQGGGGMSFPKTEDIVFGLKDGQRALVRFLHDSTSAFDVVSTHSVTVPVSQYKRRVECLRHSDEQPLADCPLCARGDKVEYRFYVHMLVYVTNADGSVSVKPMVWDRPVGFAYELKEKIASYGALSQHLFTIKRQGAGFNDTRYFIEYAIPQAYPAELYPYDPDLFSNTIKFPHIFLAKKTLEELQTYVATGAFPERVQQAAQPTYQQQVAQPVYQAPVQAAPAPAAPVYPQAAPAPVPQYTAQAPAAPQFVPPQAPQPQAAATPPWQAPNGVVRQY